MKLIIGCLLIHSVVSSCVHKNPENYIKDPYTNPYHEIDISYQVAIFAADQPNMILCAGALISKKHILAPASCVDTHYGVIAAFGWANPGTKFRRHIGPEDMVYYPTWPKRHHRNIPEVYKTERQPQNYPQYDADISQDDDEFYPNDEYDNLGRSHTNFNSAGKKVKTFPDKDQYYESHSNGESNYDCDCDPRHYRDISSHNDHDHQDTVCNSSSESDWKENILINQYVDNIVILILQNPIECKENIRPISLPYLHESSIEFSNLNIFETGWTNLLIYYPALPYITLQAVAQCSKPQLPNRACFYSIEDDRTDLNKTGGLLVANSWDDDKLILIGLSLGINNFETLQVFIKIAPYVNWIRTKIGISNNENPTPASS